MSHLKIQFPRFGDVFDGFMMRAFVRQLEDTLARVKAEKTNLPFSVTGDTTLTAYDTTVLVDTSSANITITLPDVADWMIEHEKEYTVKKVDAANRVMVSSPTSTVDGATGVYIYNLNTSLTFRATDDGWKIV